MTARAQLERSSSGLNVLCATGQSSSGKHPKLSPMCGGRPELAEAALALGGPASGGLDDPPQRYSFQ